MDFSELKSQMFKFWKQMSVLMKTSLGVFLLLLLAGFILTYMRANETEYVTLYSDLKADEAGTVIHKLKTEKVPYKIKEGGKVISVPYDKVDELRLSLAREGIPKTGVGYEIFDKKSWGMTNFEQKVNYKRAMEGELARTICEIKEVEFARVHLALPEERLYKEDQKEPSASVLVKLKAESKLTSLQVQAIAALLAHSIEGLNSSNISIVDYSGNILFAGRDELSLLDKNTVKYERTAEGQTSLSMQSPNSKSEKGNVPGIEGKEEKHSSLNLLQRYYWVLLFVIIPLVLFKIIKVSKTESKTEYVERYDSVLSVDGSSQKIFESADQDIEREKLEEFKSIDTQRYFELLQEEEPQVVSIILAQLQPSKAGDILNQFPAEKQVDIALSLSRIEELAPEVRKRVEEAFKSQILTKEKSNHAPLSEGRTREGKGGEVLQEVLSFADDSTRRNISDFIERERNLT